LQFKLEQNLVDNPDLVNINDETNKTDTTQNETDANVINNN